MPDPGGQHANRDLFNIQEVKGDVTVINQDRPPTRLRDEHTLLMAVRDEVASRLHQSLHHAVFLNLGKAAQPEQVKRPWDREIKVGAAPVTAIPDDTTIAQVFASPGISGKLLILGQPGAGKTTTLLDLAKALVEQAEADDRYPLPVLFNLSSWRDEKQPIRDWLVAELKSKYGVSTKLGKRWVTERVILPLLDGLDEVASERQEQCVQQLNAYLTGEASPLYAVVCSRLAEYEHYETVLQLNGAVYLKALSDAQIQSYLSGVGRAELWGLLAQSPALLAFVRAPLLLSMAVIAYPQGSSEQWSALQSATEQLQYLLDAYVERMLHREFESRAYVRRQAPSARQTRGWLVWLAQLMEQSAQTEFLIEGMQPSMLSGGKLGEYQLLVRLLFGPVVGLLFGLLGGLLEGLVVGLVVGLVGGLSIWLVGRGSTIKSVEVLRWSSSKEPWLFGLLGGLLFGLLGGLFGGLVMGLVIGLFGGLVIGLFGGLFFGLQYGGLACIQHFTLRLLLYRSKAIPWNYARFLNYATERLFLQRVGGRYRFMHKLL